jgi:hypothetical protein
MDFGWEKMAIIGIMVHEFMSDLIGMIIGILIGVPEVGMEAGTMAMEVGDIMTFM